MKYIVMIGDGMADRPVEELGGKTPLQKAATPNMDKLVQHGIIGKIRTVPPGYPPGSDIANLNILGYDPKQFYSGRAPLEAASIGINLKDDDVAYRCNLVTLKYNKDKTKAVMDDYSSGHITTEEAGELIHRNQRFNRLGHDHFLSRRQLQAYHGLVFRHCRYRMYTASRYYRQRHRGLSPGWGE